MQSLRWCRRETPLIRALKGAIGDADASKETARPGSLRFGFDHNGFSYLYLFI